MPRKKPEIIVEVHDTTEATEGLENLGLPENQEGEENVDHENMIHEGDCSTGDGTFNENAALVEDGLQDANYPQDNVEDVGDTPNDVAVEVFDEADFNEGAETVSIENNEAAVPTEPTASTPRQRRPRTPAPASILTLEVGGEVITQKDKDDVAWHEIKNSQVSGTHLTGQLGKVESLENGALIALVDYKGQRIAIPLKEMMINLERPAGQSDNEYNERLARVLNRMMGAEIDFVVRGITGTGEERAAVASRKAAMLRLRRRYYLTNGSNGRPQVYPDRIVEARITAVSQMAIRVEIFGVETSIRNQDLSWGYIGDARDLYYVGDTVQVKVFRVTGDTPESLAIRADVKSLTADNTREKLLALKPQTNIMGRVTDVRQGVIFVNLIEGIRAVSHRCFDKRKPGRGDDVLFIVTKIDEESNTALGIVSRIVKRNI
ncbi:MAG: S1 RNA-binding domain-containing protein [Oscillospiraceae bacterium]|nr:S1 RNA-binding domain-containing protein [Oscillospiraceae bacterium]